ncbi:MAG: FtsX-like permease family protein [Bacteroidales bacterium]|nr:FtsX-like permease family protein [Bacteroidales bacterium]
MKSYLKFLSRNKLYTAIEAVGLAVSLAFVIIIGSYVVQQFEVKYENPLWRDIYTFAMVEDGHPDQLGLTYTFTDAIQEAAPEVEMAGRLSPVEMLITPKEGTLQAKVVTADRNFFTLFPNLTFVDGSPEVLSDTGNMIISEEFSHKSGLHVGDIWKLGQDSFTVAAIMKNWKSTLFEYADIVLSIDGPIKSFTDPNDQFGSVYTFVKLSPGADRNALQEKAATVCKGLYGSLYGTSFLQGIQVYRVDELLFGDVHGDTINGNIAHSDKRTLDLLLAAVLLLLVSAVFNYINLNMALSAKRAREMATRRLIGASQASIFGRRILESLLFTLVCFAVSILLAVWWTPMVNRLLNDPDIAIRIQFTPKYIAIFIGLVLMVGFLAGLLPALFSSRWKPIDVVRGNFRAQSKMTFSKVFIVLQSALSVFLIAMAIVMEAQYRKSLNRPVHADIGDKYFLNVASFGLESLRSSLESLPFVRSTGLAVHVPGQQAGGQYSQTVDGKDILYRVYHMDKAAFDMLGFEVLADYNAPVNNTVWFGESAFAASGFTDASHDIGILSRKLGNCENMGGVIADFPVSLSNMGVKENMIVLVNDMPTSYPYTYGILMEIGGDHEEARKQIRESYETWKKDNMVYYELADGYLTEFYEKALRPARNNMRLMEVFMILALLLSLLDLLAMSTFYADEKARDIAVRKVFGGTVDSETRRSIREYMVLVGIACIIGIPIAVWAAQKYLESYIYRLESYGWIFVLAVVLTFAMAFGSVLWQTLKAARTNPAVELKKE